MSEISVAKEIEGKTYYTSELVEMLSNQSIEKDKEIERLNNIIYKIEENCKLSIYSINNILTLNKICPFTKDGKILINRYQEVRLKAFRTKCKEILKLIESEDK